MIGRKRWAAWGLWVCLCSMVVGCDDDPPSGRTDTGSDTSGDGSDDTDSNDDTDGGGDPAVDTDDDVGPEITVPGLHINELLIVPASQAEGGEGGLPGAQWVEIFNGGPDEVELGEVALASGSTFELGTVALPEVTMPANSYFTVFVTIEELPLGIPEDLDLSDGDGFVYTDTGGFFSTDVGGIFSHTGDGVALLSEGGEGDALAFMAYGEPAGTGFSSLESLAVASNLWTEGETVALGDLDAGETIGLVVDGFHGAGAGRLPVGQATLDRGAPTDYRVYDWEIYQRAGFHQPQNPLTEGPLAGSIFAAGETVELSWAACPGASNYLVELSDRLAFAADDANTLEILADGTSYELERSEFDFAKVFWRVRCQYQRGDRTFFLAVREAAWSFTWLPEGMTIGAVLGVPHRVQHKDSPMLCLYNAAVGDTAGCLEQVTLAGSDESCHWNAPHPVLEDRPVGACGIIGASYASRAAIQMVHDFFDPEGAASLSQDTISYVTFVDVDPVGAPGPNAPEGDMGVGLAMNPLQAAATLAQVLGVERAQVTIVSGPTFAEIAEFIANGRPVILFRRLERGIRHVTVVDGVTDGDGAFSIVHVLDPSLTVSSGEWVDWDSYTRAGISLDDGVVAVVPPAEVGELMSDPPTLFLDLDSDGLSDFDELLRLDTDFQVPDSDRDQVSDYQEIYSYTLALGPQTPLFRPVDPDEDGQRPELDCDSDADGDHDGGEDIAGNGGHDEEGGVGVLDTDVYDSTDFELDLGYGPQPVPIGETALYGGGTLAANTTYTTMSGPCFSFETGDSFNPDGPPLVTNDQGVGEVDAFVCETFGCFQTYVDRNQSGFIELGCDFGAITVNCVCEPADATDDGETINGDGGAPGDADILDITAVRNFDPERLSIQVLTATEPADGRLDLVLHSPEGPFANHETFAYANGGRYWGQILLVDGEPPDVSWSVWNNDTVRWEAGAEDWMDSVTVQRLLDENGLSILGPLFDANFSVDTLRVISWDSTDTYLDALPERTAPTQWSEFFDLKSCSL